MVATSERANRQFWVVLDDRLDHTKLARIEARIVTKSTIRVETSNVGRFTILLSEAPSTSKNARIVVDGHRADLGPYALGDRMTISRIDPSGDTGSWQYWDGVVSIPGTKKIPRLSGPLGDVSWEPQVHVYGTLVPGDTATLKKAAELGARGWIMDREFTQVRHPVIPDTDLTPDLIRERALVLYGNARNNSILAEIGSQLPIRVGTDFLEMRGERLTEAGIGAKFVCPNPLRPEKYLVVQTGLSASAVEKAGFLPMFLPDYLVFDNRFTSTSQKMALGTQPVVETGFFTEMWQLPELPSKKEK